MFGRLKIGNWLVKFVYWVGLRSWNFKMDYIDLMNSGVSIEEVVVFVF